VRLTAAGVRLVDRMIAVHLDNETRLLAGLPAPDRQLLSQLLERLAVSIDAAPEVGAP
jgi:DNA-binding MarR family transcriptional regulator